ncbi:MAG: DUF4342 domain-containing protein [Chloroflexota bacterium]
MSDNAEKIHVEEEPTAEETKNNGSDWTDEFKVAGEELVNAIKGLFHETNVRRIVVENEERGIHFEIPVIIGVIGIAALPVYAAIAMIAAVVSECTIRVERAEKAPEEAVQEEAAS